MPVAKPQAAKPSGFTLLELLVVIAIIAVLASLLLAGVFKAYATAKMVQNRNNIVELEAAIAEFKQTFQVDYLPSHIDFSGQDPVSAEYLSHLYPNAPSNWFALPTPYTGPNPLNGSQCLIFFLGGVNTDGFSSNPSNPLQPAPPGGGEQRKGPFMDFKKIPTNRFINGMLSDVYGNPFAYFSTTGTPNSYTPGKDPAGSGCFGPYLEPNSGKTFLKPDSFQIISAGANGQWNNGNVWPAKMAASAPGFDDICNFATGPLGSGQ